MPIDFLLAEVFVGVRLTLGQHDGADGLRGARRRELDALLVEVVALGDAPVELDVVDRLRFGREHERDVGIEVFVVARGHGFRAIEDLVRGAVGRGDFDRRVPDAGRITQAGVRAPLPLELQRDGVARLRAIQRRGDLEGAAKNLLFAEVLVVVDFALRVTGSPTVTPGVAAERPIRFL